MCRLNPRRPHDEIAIFSFFFFPSLFILILNFLSTDAILQIHGYFYFFTPGFYVVTLFALVFFTHRKYYVSAQPLLIVVYTLFYLSCKTHSLTLFRNPHLPQRLHILIRVTLSRICNPLVTLDLSSPHSLGVRRGVTRSDLLSLQTPSRSLLVHLPVLLPQVLLLALLHLHLVRNTPSLRIQVFMLTFLALFVYQCFYLQSLPSPLKRSFTMTGVAVIVKELFLLLRFKSFRFIMEAMRGFGLWRRVSLFDRIFLVLLLCLALASFNLSKSLLTLVLQAGVST